MTVYESITGWLNSIINEIRNPPFTAIDLEKIMIDSDRWRSAGIFSSPNDSYTSMLGGQTYCEEFKSFYLRETFNLTEDRITNEVFFEHFRDKIKDRNLDGIMPKDERDWIKIEINGGIYPAQRATDEMTADYLVSLKLEWFQ